jgi:hypothetical protein
MVDMKNDILIINRAERIVTLRTVITNALDLCYIGKGKITLAKETSKI